VHGKGSIVSKMPGDDWRRFAGARAYYGFMWGHPGKKLLFMGQEFGQTREWDYAAQLDWGLLEHAPHRGLQAYVRDLNRLYRSRAALHARDCESDGFQWVVVDDADNSVFAFLRFGEDRARPILVVSNFTPVPRPAYRLGLPGAGRWREILNSDAVVHGRRQSRRDRGARRGLRGLSGLRRSDDSAARHIVLRTRRWSLMTLLIEQDGSHGRL
jgi:1,4-alpha-glucan branching enzyme